MPKSQPISDSKHRRPTHLLKPKQGRLFILATLFFLLLGLRAAPVSAATITVCASGCDHTTIAAAIAAATAGDTISLSAETFTEAGLTVDKNLTITGDSASTTIVQAHASAGSATDRVFNINSGVTATFENLTIRHGNANFAGGIYNQGTLTINTSIISSNNSGAVANTNGGGGILNNGTLTVNNSTIRDNTTTSANAGGAGIRSGLMLTVNNSTFSGNIATGNNTIGGAIRVAETAVINNSTFSGNSSVFGGAIGTSSGATLTLRNSTVSGNTTTSNAFALGDVGNLNATLHLINTIIANNMGAGDACTSNTTPQLATDTNNLIEGTHSCGSPVSTADPMLGTLADNGGPTLTHALLTGSPAIDAGDNAAASAFTTDQRGAGFDRVVNTTVDIGAFEVQPATVIDLSFFLADVGDSDPSTVKVSWETAAEIDNAGFNLHRATSLDGPYLQINNALIAATGQPDAGERYSFIDTPGTGTFFYKLEDVDIQGGSSWHGPVSVELSTPTAVSLSDLAQQESSKPYGLVITLALLGLVGLRKIFKFAR